MKVSVTRTEVHCSPQASVAKLPYALNHVFESYICSEEFGQGSLNFHVLLNSWSHLTFLSALQESEFIDSVL